MLDSFIFQWDVLLIIGEHVNENLNYFMDMMRLLLTFIKENMASFTFLVILLKSN